MDKKQRNMCTKSNSFLRLNVDLHRLLPLPLPSYSSLFSEQYQAKVTKWRNLVIRTVVGMLSKIEQNVDSVDMVYRVTHHEAFSPNANRDHCYSYRQSTRKLCKMLMGQNVHWRYPDLLWICWEIPLTTWTEAVSISASWYCDTLSRQQKSMRYFLCSRDDDVIL